VMAKVCVVLVIVVGVVVRAVVSCWWLLLFVVHVCVYSTGEHPKHGNGGDG